ncbi:MAG: hypothetical protein AB1306_09030 [Nitrospirota bacterium]
MKTISEEIFESFLNINNLEFEKINEDSSPRPDYLVKKGDLKLAFEVKELSEDDNFKTELSSRIIGNHIRKKIHGAKKQIQFAAKQGIPSILLIYNNIDPSHLFGTETMDFITAMYGEYTVRLNNSTSKIIDSYHGQNQLLSEAKNTSYSAVGKLFPYLGQMKVTLFENIFSKVKIQYEKLPSCFDFINIKIDSV